MVSTPTIRRKKDLDIFLERVPKFISPDPKTEQYRTPATVAADILFNAYSAGDIAGKHVVDLGCGTGIFAVGAKMLGAGKVQGLDVDPEAVKLALNFAAEHKLEVDFEVMDVTDCNWSCDTVIQNPPFGAQTRNADRAFLEKAVKIADVIYSLHNAPSSEFVRVLIGKLGCLIDFEKKYIFKIEHTFDFHTKPFIEHETILFRIEH